MNSIPWHLNARVPHGAVVVALDGGPGDRAALGWGAQQARSARRALHLVHVLEVRGSAGGPGGTPAGPPADEVADALALSRERAHHLAAAAEPTASVDVVVGHPLPVLVALSHQAHLVVLGGARRAAGQQAFLAMRARCPVAVVPGRGAPPHAEPLPTAHRRAVVVGLDGTHAARGALDLAFAHAARSGDELSVVHVWPPRSRPGPGHDPGWDEQRRALSGLLAGHRARHPGVVAVTHLVRGDAAQGLVDRSRGAGLLVLGGCDGARRPGLMPGPVTLGVLARAACPVVMVRDSALGDPVRTAERELVGASR